MNLTGIHHLTAVTADVRANFRFYTRTLGMRLVKRTVNQDDVSAYHLFYADGVGTPGTDITFFDWNLPRETRGTRSVTRTALRVRGDEAMAFWETRFRELSVKSGAATGRDGRLTLDFEDGEGQRLCLIDDSGASNGASNAGDEPQTWDASPVPAPFQVRGLGPITISVPDLAPTAAVLTGVLGMRQVREYEMSGAPIHVFEMGAGGPHAELHVAVEAGTAPARPGAGGVHHVAFRTPNVEEYHAWFERLQSLGVRSSGEIDRFYFQSLYFREPGGVLFEIATDGPGFAVDEDAATLGEKVALPPFLEARRTQIVANLKPLD